jgi:uncharacterized protein (DUF2336 family)
LPQPSTDKASPAGVLTLSAEDVDRLLHDTTSGTRIDMTNKIGSSYNTARLSKQETMVAEQIFRLLMRDTETNVRVALAQHVKDSGHIPTDIVKALARDVEEVSLPILEFSSVLTDDDLVELAQSTDQVARYLAISRRRVVSEKVSDVLIAKGNDQVTTTLVKNVGAAISEVGYDRIVSTFHNNDAVMQSLTLRSQLPLAIVDKMISVVSASFADTLKQKYKSSAGHIEKEVEKIREKETLNLIRVAQGETDIDSLIGQLRRSGRLTPSIILSALCQGDFNFFEQALARLSDVPVANARKLIGDRGDLGFRAIYNKSGLPDAMFPAVKLLLKIVHQLHDEGEKAGSPRYANRIVERILQHSEEKNMENLSYIIALVRRVAQ